MVWAWGPRAHQGGRRGGSAGPGLASVIALVDLRVVEGLFLLRMGVGHFDRERVALDAHALVERVAVALERQRDGVHGLLLEAGLELLLVLLARPRHGRAVGVHIDGYFLAEGEGIAVAPEDADVVVGQAGVGELLLPEGALEDVHALRES